MHKASLRPPRVAVGGQTQVPPEQPAAEVVAEVEAEAEEGVEDVEEVRMYRAGGPPTWRIRRVRVHNEIPESVSLD